MSSRVSHPRQAVMTPSEKSTAQAVDTLEGVRPLKKTIF